MVKSKDFSEGLIPGQDGKLYECLHPQLSQQSRDVTQGNTKTKANFIICDKCGEIVAFLPSRSKPTQNPLQQTVNNLNAKIDELEKQLAKCRSGQG